MKNEKLLEMFKATDVDMLNDNVQVMENDIKKYDQIDKENKDKDGMDFTKEDTAKNNKAIKKAYGKMEEHVKPQVPVFVPN